MALDYYSIFRQKTGVDSLAVPWDEAAIDSYLAQASYVVSHSYATPWSSFTDVSEKYKYGVVLLAALEYWWKALADSVTKFDISVGGGSGASQKSATVFERIIAIIRMLQVEIEEFAVLEEGSGDIIVGDFVKRSKFSGYLIPDADDVRGDWLS